MNMSELQHNLIIIDHQIGGSISQRGLDNFSMILREETLTPMKLENHNMNMGNPVVHCYQPATFAERMVIMQTNV